MQPPCDGYVLRGDARIRAAGAQSRRGSRASPCALRFARFAKCGPHMHSESPVGVHRAMSVERCTHARPVVEPHAQWALGVWNGCDRAARGADDAARQRSGCLLIKPPPPSYVNVCAGGAARVHPLRRGAYGQYDTIMVSLWSMWHQHDIDHGFVSARATTTLRRSSAISRATAAASSSATATGCSPR